MKLSKKILDQKLLSMKNLLSLWKLRNLTLYSRITILKSLALSKLVYNTSVLATPWEFVSSVQTTISRFVWNNKPKIKHTTMIGLKFKGGLDLPDFKIINNALKSLGLEGYTEAVIMLVGAIYLLHF